MAGSTIGTALQRGARRAEGFDVALHFLKRVEALAADAFDTDAQIELKPVTIGNHTVYAFFESKIKSKLTQK